MSASYGATSVTTSATNILAANNGRRGFVIANNGSNIVYIGFDSGVLSSNGIQIMPQDKFELSGEHSTFKGSVWGITSSGAADVRWWDYTP